MNPPKVTDEDYIQFLIATPKVCTALYSARRTCSGLVSGLRAGGVGAAGRAETAIALGFNLRRVSLIALAEL